MSSEPRSYCAAEVRRLDRERYLAALFAPSGRREALFALYAFNLEVAKTAEVVSEPMLGEIRLQWWREALDGIFAGSVREHPVVAALAEAVEAHELDRARFEAIVDGRAADLDPDPPPDMYALEAYAGATAVPLVELACQILGAGEAMAAARAAGLGLGLAGVLRAVPFHARQRRLYVPLSLLSDAGIAAATLFDRAPPVAFAEAVAPIAERARAHIAAVRQARRDVPRTARAAFLPLAVAEAHLSRLARNGHDAFDPRIGISPLAAQLRIALAALGGRYSAASAGRPDQPSRSASARLQ
ncbi:MAG: squalene/phytoene synthase family protein [Defluviicoccus sp.]|nr:squalene/phytoene synthase family protein [Defluviicoccus sp.]MDE0383512.1 squalene/phytoene synthase family protein [Defluviicoccus sp.]